MYCGGPNGPLKTGPYMDNGLYNALVCSRDPLKYTFAMEKNDLFE